VEGASCSCRSQDPGKVEKGVDAQHVPVVAGDRSSTAQRAGRQTRGDLAGGEGEAGPLWKEEEDLLRVPGDQEAAGRVRGREREAACASYRGSQVCLRAEGFKV